LSSQLIQSEILFQIEFDVVPEPKALLSSDLKNLVKKYGSFKASAEAVEVSEAFIRQNAQEKKYRKKIKYQEGDLF